jgi:hypothetical protein
MKSSRHEKAPIAPTIEAHEAERKSSRKNVMTNHSTAVTPDNLPAISYSGSPVVTTALLAKLYGSEAVNLIKNYQRNADRFVAGKHFYKVEGDELKALKNSIPKRHAVDGMPEIIGAKAKSVMLWTERGAARHAKMLDTDEAWEVFEKLEDSYFGKQAPLLIEHKPESQKLTPAHQRHILNRVAELAGMDRKKYPAVWRGIKDHFQVGSYKDIPDSQYPAVCEFMLCKPLDAEIPTARIISDETPESTRHLNIHFPIEELAKRRPGMLVEKAGERIWADITLHDLRDLRDMPTPCESIIFELQRAGYKTEGAWLELRTYRNKLRELTSFVAGLNRVVEDPQRYAVKVEDAA